MHFDSSLQTLLMLAFYTTIGLMASLKLIKKGGTLLVSFFIAVSVLVVLQNLVGMTIAQAMGLDKHYGILAGSVSMMGGLGTAAAFGPFFEHTYGVTGGTAVGSHVRHGRGARPWRPVRRMGDSPLQDSDPEAAA